MLAALLDAFNIFLYRVEKKDDWQNLHEIADAAVSAMEMAFLKAVAKLQSSVILKQVEGALLRGDNAAAIASIDWSMFQNEAGFLNSIAISIMNKAGEASAESLVKQTGISMRFDLVNPHAVKWAQEHGAELVTQITETTRDAIRAIIVDAVEHGGHPYQTARQIKKYIGLTDKQMLTVQNYWREIVSDGTRTAKEADAMAETYAKKLLKRRAETIARTETMTASNAGQQALWMDAIDKGLIDKNEMWKKWIVTPDDKLCPICQAIGAEKAPIDEVFPIAGVMHPPKHPNCRCAYGLVTKPVMKYKLRKHLPGKHDQKTHGRHGLSLAPSNRDDWPEHIKAQRIPPAWTGVHISKDPKSDLWATGRDKAGRMQYVYSPEHKEQQSIKKFRRIEELEVQKGVIDAQIAGHLKSSDPRLREHAECALLISRTGVRPGSDAETGATQKAYGATTLKGQHVVVEGDQVRLRFVGKRGVPNDHPVTDRELGSKLRERASRAGPDGKIFPEVTDSSLLGYVHKLDGGSFKTKDFRTLLATQTARALVDKSTHPTNDKEYKKQVKDIAATVAKRLGNTPTVALQSYINPVIFAEWKVSAYGIVPLGIEKHLPGKHDQKTHGRRGAAAVPTYDENGVISGGPVNTVKAVLNNPDLLNTSFKQHVQGDVLLHTMCTETGFAGKPKVVSKEDLDKHISAGGTELFRGMYGENHMQHVADFKHGELYVGKGVNGNGTYTAYGEHGQQTALKYTETPYGEKKGSVMRMSLEKDAKIISLDDLMDMRRRDADAMKNREKSVMSNAMERSKKTDNVEERNQIYRDYQSELRGLEQRHFTLQQLSNDEGKYAVMKGYDAIRVAAHGHMVVLNRSKVLVEE